MGFNLQNFHWWWESRLQHSCQDCSLCWRICIWVLSWLPLPLQVLERHFVVGILGRAAERLSVTHLPCCSFSPSGCCWSLVRYQLLWLSPPLPFLSHFSLIGTKSQHSHHVLWLSMLLHVSGLKVKGGRFEMITFYRCAQIYTIKYVPEMLARHQINLPNWISLKSLSFLHSLCLTGLQSKWPLVLF